MNHVMAALVGLAGIGLSACTGGDLTTPTGSTGPTGETATKPTGDSGKKKVEIPGPDLEVGLENNYSYSVDWSFPSYTTPLYQNDTQFQNLTVNWGAVGTDAWGEKRASTSYDVAVLLLVVLSEKEFSARWNTDDLNSGTDLSGVWTTDITGQPSLKLADMEDSSGYNLGLKQFNSPGGAVFFLGIADQVGDRYDIRLGAFLTARSGGQNPVPFGATDNSLSFSSAVDGVPLRTAEVHDEYTAEWRDVDYTVHGTTYDRFLSDELFIGHWPAGASAKELGANVHDLKATATGWWTGDISGNNDLRLELMRDEKGLNFGGFTKGGTWVIGARCTSCYGAAPWWLSLVEVE